MSKVRTNPLDGLAMDAFGMTKSEAHAKNVCIQCKEPASWYSEAGKREYQLSGMCETCYDKLWEEGK